MHSTVFASNDLDMCWIMFLYNDNMGSAGSRERVWEDMLTLGRRPLSFDKICTIHSQTEGLCVCVCLYLCICVCVNVLTELWFSFQDDMEHSFTCVCMCVGFLHVCVDLCVNVVTKGRWLSLFDNICSIHSLCCTTDHGDL